MSKEQKERVPSKKTQIACYAPGVRQVCVAGTFNGWSPTATPMTKAPDGRLSVALDLPPGRYEYKFVADGRWCCDPSRPDDSSPPEDSVPNDCGTMNRVLEVG